MTSGQLKIMSEKYYDLISWDSFFFFAVTGLLHDGQELQVSKSIVNT